MTEKQLRESVVNYLTQYIGIKEGSDEHKSIIKVFNDSHLCKRYSMTVYDSWCATAVSSAFIASGLVDIFPCVECSCSRMQYYADQAGIWVEDDAYKPQIGDIVLYDWQDDGNGDCDGIPDHVGIVAEVKSKTFRVIEGNKNNTVGYRLMNVNSKYIRGFITPNYSIVSSNSKTNKDIALEVIAGEWGNGEERKKKLTEKGYDYSVIQRLVNQMIKESCNVSK